MVSKKSKKQVAPESSHVERMRKKIQHHLSEEDAQVTPQSIQEVVRSIESWIKRHQSERLNLEDKSIQLFDRNTHPAPSRLKAVQVLANKLQKEMAKKDNEQTEKATPSLSDRVQAY